MQPRRAEGALQRELPDGETVLLGADGQQALVLNALGGVVWSLCDGEHTPEQMAALIVQALPGTDPAQVAADLEALLRRLEAAGFLESGVAGTRG
jgi:hypothetical protein